MTDSKKNILIIDDHDSIRFLLGSVLNKKYNVTTKKDGLDALAYLGTGNIPDLILLDMRMERLSGLEFLSNIRSSGFYSDIPVLVISAVDNSLYLSQCEKLGVEGYVPKPFNPITLHEKISDIFNTVSTN